MSTCEFLDWDSRFFGLRIARLAESLLTPESVACALSWCLSNQIDCLYFLADSGSAETVRLAEDNAFRLVDIRLTLENSMRAAAASSPAVRPFQPMDAAPLRAIARVSHRDSRFYYDARFSSRRCDDFYETWIERSFDGWADAVLVAEWQGSPAGYISCHLSPEAGSIGLFAVAREYRQKGLGHQLVAAALEYFRQKGLNRATVVTQGRNVASQRVYQHAGFVTRSVQLWYHLWLKAA